MNSERHEIQLYVEGKIGCFDAATLPQFLDKFEQYQVSHSDLADIQACAEIDRVAYLRKSIQSYLQGLLGLSKSHETWSTIKFYYCLYYLQRAELLFHGHAFLRCKSIYILKLGVGEAPEKKTGKKYQGDHKATIAIYTEKFPNEVLLSQSIEEKIPLYWISEKRDWVNYRKRDFIDGAGMMGMSEETYLYQYQISDCCDDSIPIICFDPDIACLTFPTKFLQSKLLVYDPDRSLLNDVLSQFDARDRSNPNVAAFLDHL